MAIGTRAAAGLAAIGKPVLFALAFWDGHKAALLPQQAFEDSTVEGEFLEEYARIYSTQRRLLGVIGLLIWTSFTPFDFFVPAGQYFSTQTLSYRISGIAILLVSISIAFTKRIYDERRIERVIILCMSFTFIALLLLSVTDTSQAGWSLAFIGLIIFIFYAATLYRLRSIATITILTTFYVSTAVIMPFGLGETEFTWAAGLVDNVHKYLMTLTSYTYLMDLFFLSIVMFMSYITSIQLESAARANFLRERRLATANRELIESRLETQRQSQAVLAVEERLRHVAEQKSFDKSKFLAAATHDLSQPLTALSMLIETTHAALASGDVARCENLMRMARGAVNIANSSFRAVLEVSQLESGDVRPVYSTFGFDEFMHEVLSQFPVLAANQGVRMRVRRAPWPAPAVRSDRAFLARILTNLVSNAIKYADPDAGDRRAVLVAASVVRGRLRVVVADNGVGIPAADLQDVFKPFVQLNNPERNWEKGLGLGLSIVSAMIDLLDGHALTLSSVEGRGTRLTLTLPVVARARALSSLGPHQADLSDLFIWCVEDDKLVREALGAMLGELAIVTELSASFDDVARVLPLTERRPDLVISDYRLPAGRTAKDVARAFAEVWADGVPMLIITGEAASESVIVNGRALEVLKKPLVPGDLIAAIRRLCRDEPVALAPEV